MNSINILPLTLNKDILVLHYDISLLVLASITSELHPFISHLLVKILHFSLKEKVDLLPNLTLPLNMGTNFNPNKSKAH
jgi:hypothetical protein